MGCSCFRRCGPYALALALGLSALPAPASAQQSGSGDAPPPAVIVAPVKAQDLSRSMDFIGRIEAIQQVDLRARVEGFLESINFSEGSSVSRGQVLFEIEKGPYEATLAGAEAALSSGQAALAGAEASLIQAQQEVDRQTVLVERGTVAQSVLDTAIARRDEAKANVEAAKAQIAAAQAQLQAARLNLSYTSITSPIDGRIGRTNVTVGNLVNPQSGVLATVVQTDPVRAVFSVSERDYVTLAEKNKDGADISSDDFALTLQLPDGNAYEHPGRITFVDNRVDPRTGTIAVFADFANPDEILVPGQFVTVTVEIGQPQHLPVVPAAAILQDKDGPYVLVLDQENRVQIRRVQTSQQTAGAVAVSTGLTEGEVIVVDGLQRVHPGQIVAPQQAPSES